MGKIVLLAVAAAWAAVLLPPLLRNRIENRPGSSVTDFRRQLSTLQRTVPTRNMTPMRTMARPLAPSPLQRPAVQQLRAHDRFDRVDRFDRGVERLDRHHTGELVRRMPRELGAREHQGRVHARVPARQVSRRELIRRRRANVLFALIGANVLTLFLAATTSSHALVYAFALAFVSLCGYVYKLAQLRQYEQDARWGEANWFHAA